MLLVADMLSTILCALAGVLTSMKPSCIDEMSSVGAELSDWQGKSTSSIYTKLTDYAKEGVSPSLLTSSGIMGIKDQLRSRLVVPNDADGEKVVKRLILKMNKVLRDLPEDQRNLMGFADMTYKDKSARFASVGGKAIYA